MDGVVTIKDVAQKAGVVKSTVSNVLTGKKFVSEALKKKVLDACRELNFHPNFYAAGLSGGKSNIIALVLESNEDVEKTFYSELVMSCLKQASANDYSLLIYYSSDNDKIINILRQGNAPIDGAVIMSPCVNDERLKQIESDRIPCIVVGRPENECMSYVDIDNVKLVRSVCEALNKNKDREIYLINSHFDLTISQDRKRSFDEYCASCGIDPESHCFVSLNCDENDGYTLSKGILQKSAVIITANASLAKGVYRAAAEQGLAVGDDVAVFALGRHQEHGTFTPKLSYAYQDYSVLGKKAIELLISEIENGRSGKNVLVESIPTFTQSVQKFL
ncbi:MAG: LacI family transcriptional regulator [Clostridiales bacterium]|nr:LacI family transcriptional regulator [Clostridiales bacterium]